MRAAYICTIGCVAECRHHLPCEIFMIDDAHPHPSERGLHKHISVDGESQTTHEWRSKPETLNGKGQCVVHTFEEVEAANKDLKITLRVV